MKKIVSTCIALLFLTTIFAQKPFDGAEVYSKNKVLYGKFEMRMKMIKGGGMLSTFYTIEHFPDGSDPHWSEIDIEVLGKNNAQIMSTNLFINDSNGNLLHTEKQIVKDFSLADDFHVYAIEWTPTYIAWFIDGNEVRRKTGSFVTHMNVPQAYRFNAWISNSIPWVGAIDKTAMPAKQSVDWLEYSSYNVATEKFTKEWRDDFNNFDSSRWSKAQWTFGGNQVDFVPQNVTIEDGNLVLAITDPNAVLNVSEEIIPDSFTARYFSNSKEIQIIGTESGNYKTQLYDITGKVLFSKEFNSKNFTIPCSTIKTGLYIVSISNNGKLFRKKIVIN